MDAERWRKLEGLYHTALEHEPEERGKFIAEACGGDTELRRELKSLLRQDVAANSPLDRPAWEDAASLLEDVRTVRLEPGMQVGPYRIDSSIGAGGMGRVYKAHDSRLGRDVALKVLREDVAEHPRRRSRLEIEARAVAALNHPHICTLHDIGPNYLVMEYIKGESLAARIRKGPIPIDQALRIAIEIASALEAAHRHGIIHRDLKPGNIMLTDSGTKLLDFGLAKFQDVRVTGEGSMAMTDTGSEQLFGTLPPRTTGRGTCRCSQRHLQFRRHSL
jgi:eukaryotic-like serine/threonine-protein kinase